MKRPSRARSSGSASVMSSPRNRICPSVTSKAGLPMITLASVDLPEPLGPISAWTSPASTVRSRPLRICCSPTCACRFLISSSGIGCWVLLGVRRRPARRAARGADLGTGRREAARDCEVDELLERRLLERARDAALDARPQQARRAGVAVIDVRAEDAAAVVRVVDEAGHRRHDALEREHDLVHRDLRGVAREAVAAVRAARALDDLGLLQQRDDALEVGERQTLGLGDRLQRDRRVARLTARARRAGARRTPPSS